MLVVEPASLRFDPGAFVSIGEENLFERVTLLELRLGQVLEKVGKTLDLLLQQSRNQHFDHTLLETVVEALAVGGVVSGSDLRAAWQRKRLREAGETAHARRRDRLRTEAARYYKGADLNGFQLALERGLEFLATGHSRKALSVLERLAATEPDHIALNLFLGEHFFANRKTALARSYLTAAHRRDGKDNRINLLFGLTLAVDGELKRAAELLRPAAESPTERTAARLGLGWIAVADRNWNGALLEFRSAAAGKHNLDLSHVLASVYYQLERYRVAEKQVNKFLENNRSDEQVMTLLGGIKAHLRQLPAARSAYLAARQLREERTGKRLQSWTVPREPVLAPIFQEFAKTRRCRVIESDSELGAMIRTEALREPRTGVEPAEFRPDELR
jgi:tetratricopeptide (TPR) repeat protein